MNLSMDQLVHAFQDAPQFDVLRKQLYIQFKSSTECEELQQHVKTMLTAYMQDDSLRYTSRAEFTQNVLKKMDNERVFADLDALVDATYLTASVREHVNNQVEVIGRDLLTKAGYNDAKEETRNDSPDQPMEMPRYTRRDNPHPAHRTYDQDYYYRQRQEYERQLYERSYQEYRQQYYEHYYRQVDYANYYPDPRYEDHYARYYESQYNEQYYRRPQQQQQRYRSYRPSYDKRPEEDEMEEGEI